MIKLLRTEIGYSIGEMAQCLGISKATYQGYDSGRRKAPESIAMEMIRIRDIDKEFMAGLPARVEKRLDKEFPRGFLSEAGESWD